MLEKNYPLNMSDEELFEISNRLVMPDWLSYMDENEYNAWIQQQTPPSDPAKWQDWLNTLEPPFDVVEWLHQLEQDAPEKEDTCENPYFKVKRTSEKQKRRSLSQDEQGTLYIQNISAYQIPELSFREEISGTTYTVTGSFEGTQNLLRKLERITAHNFSGEIGEGA